MARLGDVCEKRIDTIKATYTGDIDYIDISSIDNKSKKITEIQSISIVDAPSRAKQLVFPGDILVSTVRPNLNAVALVTESADNTLVASTGYCVLRCLPNTYNKYVFYFCQSPAFIEKMVTQATGASYPAVTSSIVKECTIPLPPLEEQRRIAATLDKVSDLIAKRRAQLDKLDLLVKARFVEMFGDPVKNDKGLPTMMGQNFFKLSNGKFVPENKRLDSGIPAYGGNGVSWCTDEILCKENTIVVGRVGFQSGNVHFVKGPLWITDNAMYISNYNTRKYDLFFLYVLMEHIDFTRFQDAGDLKKITQKPFMSMEYIMPTLSRQREYVAFAKQIDKSKLTLQQSLDKLETLKKALMQQYFG